MPPPMATARTAAALADAGLIAPERLPALEKVAAQYAVAVTPAMLRSMGLRGLMGTISRVYDDGNNRPVLDDQPLLPGIVYAARFDRATTIDFRTLKLLQADKKTRLRSDAPATVWCWSGRPQMTVTGRTFP